METVIATTEAVIEKIMERVLDKKLPQPPEESKEQFDRLTQPIQVKQEQKKSRGVRF